MKVECPRCARSIDVTGRAPGTPFPCECGVIVRAPAAKGENITWVVIVIVVALFLVTCVGSTFFGLFVRAID